jgi:thiamine biosynthesis protein ThiI
MFEKKLMENIMSQIRRVNDASVYRVRGRMFVKKTDNSPFNDEEIGLVKDGLSKVFGLESFSPSYECEKDANQIFEGLGMTVKSVFDRHYDDGKKVVSFGVRARRSDKSFPLRSNEIEIKAAEIVESIFGESRLSVNLKNPDVWVGIEVRETCAFVYYDVFPSPGGLPVGSNSPVLAMLSGGIDSPVACHMIMKRGCHVDFLTFHSHPYTSMDSVEKVKRLVGILNGFQPKGRLFSCNLAPLQKNIRDICTAKYRTVLYRRMMLRAAEAVCAKNGFFGVVTGESVGQVASQTIINLATISAASPILVLRPMCGMDKRESIYYAQRIGTYETSIEPAADSCTVFAPPQPAINAKLEDIEGEERKLGDWKALLDEIVDKIEVFDI